MAKVVVLGIEGEENLWVADLEAGTVSKIATPESGALKTADDLRKAGATVTKGVNLAALARSADSAAGGFMDG